MQKVSGENGGGGEVGVDRRKIKRRRTEEDLKNEDVGLGGDGVQGWFGGGNSNGLTVGEEIARLFGEVSDGNGCLGLDDEGMQQLWACGDGEAACGNVDRVLGGGGEGSQGGYGEVIGGIGGLGLDGEAVQLWGSEDACENGGGVPVGQGIHVDEFGKTACETDGLILGGGEEIQNAYGEDMSEKGGLDDGKSVQLWNSGIASRNSTGVLRGQGIQAGGSIENAFKNDGLGFDSEGFQDFFSKVNDENLVDGRIQALFGEGSVGNSGLSFGGEGIQFWFGEVARTTLDGKGVQGLFGDDACGNGGEAIQCEPSEIGGRNGDRQEVVGLKGKRGRPKGSKYKKTVAADDEEGIERLEGASGENGVSDEVVRSKAKQGRPKGSKNKKKSLEMDKNHGTPGNNVDGNSNEQGTLCLTALDNERLILVGDKDTGSVVEVAISGNELRNEIVGQKKKRGRPKGSKNKKKNLSSQGNKGVPGEVVRPTGLEYERRTLVGEEERKLPFDATRSEGGNEITHPKDKRGRPKGSKNKKESSSGQENQGMPGDIAVVNDGGEKTVCPTSVENGKLNFVGQEDRGLPIDDVEGGNGIVWPKDKRELPKSSKDKKKNSAGQENGVPTDINGGDKTLWPMAVENERLRIGDEGGNEIVWQTNEHGGPKGSKKMNYTAGQENEEMAAKIVAVNDGYDKSVWPTELENERQAFLGKEDKGLPSKATNDNKGGNEIVGPKNKRGRPKGSKNKQKNLIGKENQGMPCKLMGRNDGSGVETFWPMWSENERPTLVSEEDQEMLVEATGGNGSADKIIQPKDSRKGSKDNQGQPEGSKPKRVILVGEALNKILAQRHQDCTFLSKLVPVEQLRYSGEIDLESNELTSESGKVWKRPRGRPRKFNHQQSDFDGIKVWKRPRGRPRKFNHQQTNFDGIKVWKRPRGRPRKFNHQQTNFDGIREGRSTSNGLENSGLSVSYFASLSFLSGHYFFELGFHLLTVDKLEEARTLALLPSYRAVILLYHCQTTESFHAMNFPVTGS
jgi:tRNA(Leu) C34 or U34 (ribose-2'-O)-methylase TrmL